MTYERTDEERAEAMKRAENYIEEARVSRWTVWVQALLLFLAMSIAGFAIAFYALSVAERDNQNYKNEIGQQPVVEHDRTIKAYEQMKSRYGLK